MHFTSDTLHHIKCITSYPYRDNSLSNESIFCTTLKRSSATVCAQRCQHQQQTDSHGRGVISVTLQGGTMHSTNHPDVRSVSNCPVYKVDICLSILSRPPWRASPAHLCIRLAYIFLHCCCWITSDEVGGVAARRQTDYQALVVGTKVVVQPVYSHTHVWAVPGCHPHIHPLWRYVWWPARVKSQVEFSLTHSNIVDGMLMRGTVSKI